MEEILQELEAIKKLCQNQTDELKTYTTFEVERILNVSKKTLSNWRDRGVIEYCCIGSKIVFTKDQIKKFITANTKYAFANKKITKNGYLHS